MSCSNPDCINNCAKLSKYRQALDLLIDDSIILDKHPPNTSTQQHSVTSNLGEHFTIIDHGKNLDELYKHDLAAIYKQNRFATLNTTTELFNSGSIICGITKSVINTSLLLFGFF